MGGGGHARVLIDCIRLSQAADPVGILDSDPVLWGSERMEVPIRGSDELLSKMKQEGVTHFVVGLGGVGDNQPRRRLFDLGVAHGLVPLTVCHPRAILSMWASIGAGCAILPGAVVNAGAHLGVNVIVNSGAIVEHDCRIEDHVHVASGARLASTVHVKAGAHIGAGATVRQGLSIGERAVVGAGAVVVKNVEPGTVVTGVPAREWSRAERGGDS